MQKLSRHDEHFKLLFELAELNGCFEILKTYSELVFKIVI